MLLSPEISLIIICSAAFLLLVSNRLPADLVAMLILLTLGFGGLVSPVEIFNGFSSPVVITLIGLFVITKALEETGVIQWIAERLNRVGRGSETRLIILFMIMGAAMSLVMFNVAAGAVLLPAAVQVSSVSKVRVSKLLIPLSFGTLLGGMATYLTTANIVMSGLLQDNNLRGLNMMDFVPTGGLIVLAGLVYMVLIGRRLLPERESLTSATMRPDFQETYKLDERMWEVRVLPGSRLAYTPLSQSGIGEILGLTVLAIWHGREAIFSPQPDQVLYTNDYLLVLGRKERVDALLEWGLELRDSSKKGSHHHDFRVDLIEVIIPPRSQAIGSSLTELRFRKQFELTAVALWREGRSYRTDVGKMRLQVGDALLVVGPSKHIRQLADDRNYIVPIKGYSFRPSRPHKALLALLVTTLVLLVAFTDILPLPEVMLAGAVAMVLLGCVTMEQFYQAVEWRVVFLIVGMLPLSIALTDTGLASRIGTALVTILQAYSPLVLVGGMFIAAMLVTQVIGGQVSAFLIGPIAINAAMNVGVSPQAMAVAVAIGCSTAFLTPLAHPVNLLMMGTGGYTFGDFFRVGAGMTVVTLLALAAALILFWNVT